VCSRFGLRCIGPDLNWTFEIQPAELADYTYYTLHLEWSPLRQSTPESSIPSPVRLVAPPSSPSVYRPVFLYTDGAKVDQLPNDGKDGPAWGVSSTDQLTPATLLWLGYDDYAIRHKHRELYERLLLEAVGDPAAPPWTNPSPNSKQCSHPPRTVGGSKCGSA